MKYYVKNRAHMMGCYNLSSKNENGGRLSVVLARNEVSRALTQEEFNSPEIQKGLKKRSLLNVSKKMNA